MALFTIRIVNHAVIISFIKDMIVVAVQKSVQKAKNVARIPIRDLFVTTLKNTIVLEDNSHHDFIENSKKSED